MENLENKVRQLEKKVEYLEKREKKRKIKSIIKASIKLIIICAIGYYLYHSYIKIKKTIDPVIETYNKIVEKTEGIEIDKDKVKDSVNETSKKVEDFIDNIFN